MIMVKTSADVLWGAKQYGTGFVAYWDKAEWWCITAPCIVQDKNEGIPGMQYGRLFVVFRMILEILREASFKRMEELSGFPEWENKIEASI